MSFMLGKCADGSHCLHAKSGVGTDKTQKNASPRLDGGGVDVQEWGEKFSHNYAWGLVYT